MTMEPSDVRRLEAAINNLTTTVGVLSATVTAEGRNTSRRIDELGKSFERRLSLIETDLYGIGGREGLASRIAGTEETADELRDDVRSIMGRSRTTAAASGGGAGVIGFSLLALLEWLGRHFPLQSP